MASSYPAHVTAVQVGSYFVGQYYQILQQRPEFAHQFYSDASAMIRVDGDDTETVSGMMQIHKLVTSLNFTGIEIKTAHSLDSWNGGVLVMVSGFVQTKNYSTRRKFLQTFFLAPQEKGFFVLNDIFHFLEDEQVPHYPSSLLAHNTFEAAHNNFEAPHNNFEAARNSFEAEHNSFEAAHNSFEPTNNSMETTITASNPISEPVSDYSLGGETQARDFVDSGLTDPLRAEENVTVDQYSIPEPEHVPESDERVDEIPEEEPVATFSSAMNTIQDLPSTPVEEPIREPQKHTYASILRVVKGQPAQSTVFPCPPNKAPQMTSEWQHAAQSVPQQSYHVASVGTEKSSLDAVEEFVAHDDEGDAKSVYVGNLPVSISVSDLEQEFKNFGRIRPDGVTIRSRKEAGVYYAFVEFEDALGVRNALKASPIEINGWQIYVEGRRPNSGVSRGRRGRGRGGYQLDASRGRFGSRPFARGGNQDSSDRDYNNRPRGNGILSRGGGRRERGLRNGQNSYEAVY